MFVELGKALYKNQALLLSARSMKISLYTIYIQMIIHAKFLITSFIPSHKTLQPTSRQNTENKISFFTVNEGTHFFSNPNYIKDLG